MSDLIDSKTLSMSSNDFSYEGMESVKIQVSPLTSSKFIFEGLIPRFSEYIHTLMFTLSIDKMYSSFFSTFIDYPYCLIENIIISRNDTKICEFSGSLLWCLIQVFPLREKENYLLAAKQGIICLKHVLPFLADSYDSNVKWCVKINETIYNKMVFKYLEKINNTLLNTGLYDNLNHSIINNYCVKNPVINLKVNINHVFVDRSTRDALYNCTFNYINRNYFKLEHDCEQVLNTSSRVFQFNWLIENPDQPGTFYDSSCQPMLKISIKFNKETEKILNHDECYILDKSNHDIPCPESIAYYTYTFEKETQSILDQDINLFSILKLKKTPPTIKITLNNHIPKNAPTHFWIDCQQILIYNNGSAIIQQ